MDSANQNSEIKEWDNDTKEKYAGIIRSLNEQENTLLNMRFSWLMNLQGLLFATFGFTWKEKNLTIIIVICILGVIAAISIVAVRSMGRTAQKNLSVWWEDKLKDYQGPPQRGLEENRQMFFLRYFRPWRILPWAFIGTWIIIMIYSIVVA